MVFTRPGRPELALRFYRWFGHPHTHPNMIGFQALDGYLEESGL